MKKFKESNREDQLFRENVTVSSLGEYLYIGDPCYILEDEYYDVWTSKNDAKDGAIKQNMNTVIGLVSGTDYGDGDYDCNHKGQQFFVDSGTIGIFGSNFAKANLGDSDGETFERVKIPDGTRIVELYIERCEGDLVICARDTMSGKQFYQVSIYTAQKYDDYEEEFDDDEFEESIKHILQKRVRESTEPSVKFVVSEDGENIWFDQDKFLHFVADSLMIDYDEIKDEGFNICKQKWFKHDTVGYYTLVNSSNIAKFITSNLDDSLFSEKVQFVSFDRASDDEFSLKIKTSFYDRRFLQELLRTRIGPFEVVDLQINVGAGKAEANLILQVSGDVTVDESSQVFLGNY